MSSSTRGRAGKYSKPKRGGGRHFNKNLAPLDADGEAMSMWAEPRNTKKDEDDSDEEEEDSDDDSDEDSDEDEKPAKQEMTREERKAAAKARKEAAIAKQKAKERAPGDMPSSDSEDEDEDEADGDMPANPNHTAKSAKQLTADPTKAPKPSDSKTPVSQLSRREREALQAQQAKERYQKMHLEGKTDEAKADLERLKLIREKREADAAQKKAEADERAEIDKEKAEHAARLARKAEAAARGRGRGGRKK